MTTKTAMQNGVPSHTLAEQLTKVTKSRQKAADKTTQASASNREQSDKSARVTFGALKVTEKLSKFLRDLPTSVRKSVEDATNFAKDMVAGIARNAFAWAEMALSIKANTTEKQFAFWIGEVLPSFGLSRATAYRYLNNARVLLNVVQYDKAREALVAITNGRGIFESVDGDVQLTAQCTTAFRKYPIPTNASYEDCLDWARHVAVLLEKQRPGRSAGTFLKAIRAAVKTLLHGNARSKVSANPAIACVAAVEVVRTIMATSEPLAAVVTAGIDDPSLPLDAIQQMAIEAMTGKQKSGGKVPAVAA